MQKHFNQQYMESDKFPEARFVGKISDYDKISRERATVHNISGQLTIHGVTKTINEKATLLMHDTYLSGSSKFRVRTADYDIKIPRMLIKNIAEEIEVTVEVKFNPVKP
jgi:polyisoprenoid-binding protein YceI